MCSSGQLMQCEEIQLVHDSWRVGLRYLCDFSMIINVLPYWTIWLRPQPLQKIQNSKKNKILQISNCTRLNYFYYEKYHGLERNCKNYLFYQYEKDLFSNLSMNCNESHMIHLFFSRCKDNFKNIYRRSVLLKQPSIKILFHITKKSSPNVIPLINL